MTKPLGRPPVEALSDLAWARVERDVMSALDREPIVAAPPPARPTSWWPRAAIAGVALAAAAVVLFVLIPRDRGHGGDLPSRVVTAEAPTAVSFGDAVITVAPTSALVLAGSQARGVDLILERGAASFAVAPRAGRPPFVVHAGAVDVRVVGTEFTITRSGDAARVDVLHGVVEVVAHGHRAYVRAGESWDRDRVWEAAIPSSATATDPDDGAAAHLSPPADAASSDVAVAPVAATRPRPAPVPAVEPRAAFEAAAALESTDPPAALHAYRALARGAGPWSANALYAAARLALDRGDDGLAATLARSYLARFPRGANAPDATSLLERIQGAPR